MISAEYLADLATEWAKGNHDRVHRILLSQGKRVEEKDAVWFVCSGNFTCGLDLRCSPVDALPQLMFAIFGPLWPMAVGGAFAQAQKIISKRWKSIKTER